MPERQCRPRGLPSPSDIDYVKICETNTLNDVKEIKSQSIIVLAVKVGKTRLIDNHVFGEKLKV